jgi:hypothetical protein
MQQCVAHQHLNQPCEQSKVVFRKYVQIRKHMRTIASHATCNLNMSQCPPPPDLYGMKLLLLLSLFECSSDNVESKIQKRGGINKAAKIKKKAGDQKNPMIHIST